MNTAATLLSALSAARTDRDLAFGNWLAADNDGNAELERFWWDNYEYHQGRIQGIILALDILGIEM